MPTYTFDLKDGEAGIEDDTGVSLPDREHALHYAQDVARELMSSREVQTRYWRLDVYDDNRECIFAIPFTSVDRTLDHLRPEWRTMMEKLCDHHRSLREAIHAACVTVRESRALLARSRGKPYLASDSGQTTIR
jgi:hypothetical protein